MKHKRLLVTGGAGFIGSAFVHERLSADKEAEITVLDCLTYAGRMENLDDVRGHPNFRFVRGSICDPVTVGCLLDTTRCDAVVNIAAESHVDWSIEDCTRYLETNVVGVRVLMDAIRKRSGRKIRFLQCSTDEVYGASVFGYAFQESDRLHPRNPYSATKAAAEMLVLAYVNTYGLDAVITRCSNNYGAFQHPEKFVPRSITRLLRGEPIELHGEGCHVRDWIHVYDHVRGMVSALERGRSGEVYNFGGSEQVTTKRIAELLLKLTDSDPDMLRFIHDRPGNDLAYRMDWSKASRELSWWPETSIKVGLESTVRWYTEHEDWWRPLIEKSVQNPADAR